MIFSFRLKDDLPEYMADIENCIRNSSFIGGQHVLEFENLFAKTIGTQHAVSCGNGTDSLHLAMKALDLGPGDEVIVPQCPGFQHLKQLLLQEER